MFGPRASSSSSTVQELPLSCAPLPALTFTQGVLVGQASMSALRLLDVNNSNVRIRRILLAVLFLRFVVFEDSKPKLEQRSLTSKRHRRNSSVATAAAQDVDIMKQLSYNLNTLPFESSRWLNVIIGQIINSYRNLVLGSPAEEGGAKGFVERAVNLRLAEEENPAYVCLDHVDVKEVNFGSSFPVCSNLRIRPREDVGSLRIDMDLDYSDNASVSVDTKVLVNFPRPKFAILPVSLSMTLVKFSATLSIEIQPDVLTGLPSVCVSLQPDFSLELTSSSLIGARAKLQDIPKVEALIAGRLRSFIIDKMVYPHKLAVKLPDIGHAIAVQEEFVMIDKDAAVDEDDFPHPAEADSDPVLDELLGPIVRQRPSPVRPSFESMSFAAQPRISPSPLMSPSFESFSRYAPSMDETEGLQNTLPGHLPTTAASQFQPSLSAARYRRPLSMSQSTYSG